MDTRLRKRLFSPALLLIVLPPLFWSGNFVIDRAVHGTVSSMTLSLWRWVLAMFFFTWKSVCRDCPLYMANLWLIVRLSLAGVVAFNSLVYVGLHETRAANPLLLNSFIPVLITLFGTLFFRERLHGVQAGGLLISCAGVVIIISHGDWHTLAALSFSHGDLIVFCAMISFAFYTLWLRSVPSNIARLGLIAAQIAVAFIFLVPLWLTEYAEGSLRSGICHHSWLCPIWAFSHQCSPICCLTMALRVSVQLRHGRHSYRDLAYHESTQHHGHRKYCRITALIVFRNTGNNQDK
ncbi:DMT family transporter [Morganella morganii]